MRKRIASSFLQLFLPSHQNQHPTVVVAEKLRTQIKIEIVSLTGIKLENMFSFSEEEA